jgi:hypothetical protein
MPTTEVSSAVLALGVGFLTAGRFSWTLIVRILIRQLRLVGVYYLLLYLRIPRLYNAFKFSETPRPIRSAKAVYT